MDFYNERRPSPRREGDDARPLDRDALIEANAQILAATPAYRQEEMRVKIRTAAVQRHRARRAGEADFSSISEYKSFICGTGDGC